MSAENPNECLRIKEAIMSVLAGEPPEVPTAVVREHLDRCAHCQSSAPQIAEEWVSANEPLLPIDAARIWKRFDRRILDLPRKPVIPDREGKTF